MAAKKVKLTTVKCPSCDEPLDAAGVCSGCAGTVDPATGDVTEDETLLARLDRLEAEHYEVKSKFGALESLFEQIGGKLTPGTPATDDEPEQPATVQVPDLGNILSQFGGDLSGMFGAIFGAPSAVGRGVPQVPQPAPAAPEKGAKK